MNTNFLNLLRVIFAFSILIILTSCDKNITHEPEIDMQFDKHSDLLDDRSPQQVYFPEANPKSGTHSNYKIVFDAWSPETQIDIYTMNVDGTNLTQLTDYEYNEAYVTWFPNGQKILYSRKTEASTNTYDIYSMNVDGTDQKNLTNNYSPDRVGKASPNNQKILFLSNIEGDGYYVMNADGSDLRKLTEFEGRERHVSWSPNSKQVLFSYDREIYIINADGSGLEKLLSKDENYEYAWAVWSPNGKKIMFDKMSQIIVDGDPYPAIDICSMNLSDGTITNLTNNDYLDWGWFWSPNGKKFIFHTTRNEKPEVYIMNADGSNPYYLMDFHPDFWPYWFPNGQIIFRKDQQLWSINEDGTNLRMLTNLDLEVWHIDVANGKIH